MSKQTEKEKLMALIIPLHMQAKSETKWFFFFYSVVVVGIIAGWWIIVIFEIIVLAFYINKIKSIGKKINKVLMLIKCDIQTVDEYNKSR